MKVLISSIGSRGDVQPLLALALELRALGNDVSLCVAPNFKEWVESFGLRCIPIGPDLKTMQGGAAQTKDGKPVKPTMKQMKEMAASTVRDQFQVLTEAARGCDLIVAATALQIAARSIAETLKIPYVFVGFSPSVFPSPDYPPHAPPPLGFQYPRGLPSFANRLLWKMDGWMFSVAFLTTLNEERAKLGLPRVENVQRHVFTDRPWLAADPVLAPAAPAADLEIVQTGAWLLPNQSALPDELEKFLSGGEPPVYFGFGSMQAADQTGKLLIDAARAAGLRSILSQGWGNLRLADAGADCISIGDVNHEKLFPRVAAVVHHGGAGTTTTASKSGSPQVIVPHIYDQYYFSRRVQELGAGVPCSARKALTSEGLASALRECSRPEIKEGARALAARIVPDGAKIAAQRLVSEFGKHRLNGEGLEAQHHLGSL
ncbi:glycosyltransferase [Pendulispora brunnea]|uniref:Glycosyltransferase n=1 Tax=Pendulispora brunnea TaxID=2905690 RepID=A0ABZ2KIL3_9BACT